MSNFSEITQKLLKVNANSALHPSGVGKSNTSLACLNKSRSPVLDGR